MNTLAFEHLTVPTIVPVTDDIVFDEKDASILGFAIKWRATLMKPLVGDYCVLLNGEVRRIGAVLHDRVQLAHGGTFHLHDIGTMSHSGGRADVFFKDLLIDTGLTRSVSCWMFHHGHSGAGRGVDAIVPCRVWEVAP
ncbi:hypothetical protein [Hyphomicrobium sp. DY-1]|uniref:hypothetical protein n=1 Tax=Hyphomicrobium sp. DY-1 TaxID=3075650 RepID=UPI0039C47593